jgi:hypothetical protein
MERLPLFESPSYVVWRANNNVQRKRRSERVVYLKRLIELIAARHNDEDINVAIGVRFPVGVRAE